MAFAELPILESGAVSDSNNSRWTVALGTFGAFHRNGGRSGLSSNGAWTGSGAVTLGQVLVGSYSSLWAGAAYFNLYTGAAQTDLLRVNMDNVPDAGCPQARLLINPDGSMTVGVNTGRVSTGFGPTRANTGEAKRASVFSRKAASLGNILPGTV